MAYTVMDVSKYNTVTAYASAAANIDGVIIRVGYRGYGSSGSLVTDNLFNTHYNGFNGKTKIGIYWFSQAITEAEAVAEANYVYNLIKDKTVDFPIYIDSEYSNSSHNGRADALSKATRTAVTVAFCERIKALGYRAGVYASDSWFNSNLDLSTLYAYKYSLWVAKYSTSAPKYVSSYDAWQYTSSGSISGVSSRCDLSYFYNDVAGWETDRPDINTYTLTVPTQTFDYTGSAIYPSFTLGNLIAGTDYTVSYSNNINAGTGTVTITGCNNYQGTRSFDFTIKPIDISSYSISLSSSTYTYTGYEIKPEITVAGLSSSNFTSSYSNNTSVGTAKATATGTGNYGGSVSTTFTITRKSIDSYEFTIPFESYEYTGSEIKPVVSATGLSQNRDYTVFYSNNIEIGTATITISGINNYTGTKTINFRVAKAAINIKNYSTGLSYVTTVYNKKAQVPEITVEDLVEGKDFEVRVMTDNINAGTVTLNIAGIGEYTGIIIKTFEITQDNLSNYTIKLDSSSYDYTGSEIKPTVTIGKLVENEDYILTYDNNTSAGVASVTATPANTNYLGKLSVTFNINRENIDEVEFTLSEYTYNYDGTEKTPEVSVEGLSINSDYTLTYKDNINAGKAYAHIVGINNYSGEKNVYFTINRKSIANEKLIVSGTKFEFDINPIEPEAYIENLVKGRDYSVSYYNNTNVGTARVIASGINNYQGDVAVQFTIIEKPIQSCTAKYGKASIKTIYRVEDGLGLRIYSDSSESAELVLGTHYIIMGSTTKKNEDFNLITYRVKGINGFSGEATYNFRVVDKEPSTPIDYEDDGVYNFGDIDIDDETAEGDYDYGDLDEGVSAESKARGDYDFDALSGMYLDKYDEDDGSNIDDKGDDSKDPEEKDDDDGVYNFGDIDLNDETAEGDYDFGDLDEGTSEESVAKGDYDFNKFSGDPDEWIAAGTIFVLDNTPMYPTYSKATSFTTKSGSYYIYNSATQNDRVRMARVESAVEAPGRSCGWCKTRDLLSLGQIKIGDEVYVNGNIYLASDGSGGHSLGEGQIMYVTSISDSDIVEYPYGVSNGKRSTVIGYVNRDSLTNTSEE